MADLPCDGDGKCMICKATPPEEEKLTCKTCVTPWHTDCLTTSRPKTLADVAQWECPDCTDLGVSHAPLANAGSEKSDSLVSAIRAIENDVMLSDVEKAKKRQELLSGKGGGDDVAGKDRASGSGGGGVGGGSDVLKLLSGSFNCSFCMQLPERPVT
nr:E3 ubiquitin-protein ligase ORTHRUS 2-like [Tanacetum cinerariifolium]